MRLLICGSRHYKNGDAIYDRLEQFGESNPHFDITVIHGGARGADTLAGDAAEELGFPVETYHANWDRHGRAAGPIRNQEMLDSGIDVVWAFSDDFKSSKGTKHMVKIARMAGVLTTVFDGNGNKTNF